MTTSYPAAIDTWIEKQDFLNAITAAMVNDLHAGIIAIETALGLNPQLPFDTVRAYLDDVEGV